MGMFDEIIENAGEPYEGGKGFEYGTHEVIIGTAESKEKKTKNNPKAAVIEIVVFDEKDNDKKATCTLYFHTEGGAKMAVTKLLGIMVHNVGEDKKDKVRQIGRQLFGKINDPLKAREVATKLLVEKMQGKKAYLVAEPQGKYKTTAYGDIWHYPAEPQDADQRADEAGESVMDGAEDITGTEEAEDVPNFDDL